MGLAGVLSATHRQRWYSDGMAITYIVHILWPLSIWWFSYRLVWRLEMVDWSRTPNHTGVDTSSYKGSFGQQPSSVSIWNGSSDGQLPPPSGRREIPLANWRDIGVFWNSTSSCNDDDSSTISESVTGQPTPTRHAIYHAHRLTEWIVFFIS